MKIKELHIIYFLLLFNVIASILTEYFDSEIIHPGTFRAILLSLFIVYFIVLKFKLSNVLNLIIILFLLYIGILTLFSSNFGNSFYFYMRLFLSTMMFPVGYYYFNSAQKLYQLTKILIYCLALFILSIIIANIFQLGTSDYLEGSFYFGAGKVNITKSMIVLVLTAPIFLSLAGKSRFKNVAVVMYLLGFIICLISIKRGVLLTIFTAIIIFYIFNPISKSVARYSIIGLLLVGVLFPFYGDVFLERLESRERQINLSEEALELEGRYYEALLVLQEFETGGITHQLFGSEIFNSTEHYNTDRPLHTDYMSLLNGSGIVGLSWWFLILIMFVVKKNQYSANLERDFFSRMLTTTFWMLIMAQLILSISGTVLDLTLRSNIMIYLGALLSVLKHDE